MAKSAMELVAQAKLLIKEVSIEQAQKLFNEGSIALDVRDLAEFEAGHIANAQHISRGVLEFKIAAHASFQNKDASIVIYCKSGGRSALAALALGELGFTNVQSMAGGYDQWSGS